MPTFRWTAFTALGLLLAGTAVAAEPDPAAVKTLSTGYATYLFAQTFRDYCVQQVPTGAAADRQAFTAWAQAQGVADIEARLPKLLGPADAAKLKTIGEGNRPNFRAALQKLGPAPQVCGVFAQQLRSDTFDLKAKLPGLAAVLGGPALSGGQGSPPAAGGGAGGTVYGVAQLSTLVGQVVASLPKKTPGDQVTRAVEAKLKTLGSPLIVTGTVDPDGGWLEQHDDRHTTRWNVRCYDFAEDGALLSPSHGKTATVVGTVHDFDPDTFIELDNCRILPGTAGLKKSSLPVADAGWRFKNQPVEQFLVAAGQGLGDSQILGVYVTQSSGVGVGGMVIITYEPYLFLKDGTVYNDPYWAPNSFNAKRSRDLEPQKWGRWTRQGKGFLIKWRNGDSETFTPQFGVSAAKPGLRLSGSYSHIGGGGNTALGGDVMVASSSTYRFRPDGSFDGGSSASATTPGVVVGSNKDAAGRYSVSGYGITLRLQGGQEKRLLFYVVDKNMLHIGGADFLR